MLRPTPEEVLRSISYTFDNLIRPDPSSALAVSYSLTVSNMLRQLLLSLQHEEELVAEDTADLRRVLDDIRLFLERVETDSTTARKISDALTDVPTGIALSKAAREYWRTLRWALEDAIKHLHGLRQDFGDIPEYRAVRQTIRDYLDRSLDRENKLIEGAFTLARR